MKKLVHALLLLVIVALAYVLFKNIMEPVRFNEAKDQRYRAAIERLKQIRTAERAYKSEYGRYTGSFDTLLYFLKNGSMTIEMQIGSMEDPEAVASRKVYRKATKVKVSDRILKGVNLDSLAYVPYTNGKKFELAADRIETTSKVVVPVFECSVHNDILLHGLNRQLVVNLNDERLKTDRYPGLKVGSLIEATNDAGNWE